MNAAQSGSAGATSEAEGQDANLRGKAEELLRLLKESYRGQEGKIAYLVSALQRFTVGEAVHVPNLTASYPDISAFEALALLPQPSACEQAAEAAAGAAPPAMALYEQRQAAGQRLLNLLAERFRGREREIADITEMVRAIMAQPPRGNALASTAAFGSVIATTARVALSQAQAQRSTQPQAPPSAQVPAQAQPQPPPAQPQAEGTPPLSVLYEQRQAAGQELLNLLADRNAGQEERIADVTALIRAMLARPPE